MSARAPSGLALVAALGHRVASRAARKAVKREYLRRDPWYATDDTCEDPCVFIGGCGRSGTTVLRETLNRHPAFAIGPETTFFCDLLNTKRLATIWDTPRAEIERAAREAPSVVRFGERFFRDYATAHDKPRWGDKTPRNVTVAPYLLSRFPNATFVHIIRDGRDVACSLRNHPRESVRGGKVVPVKRRQTMFDSARRWLTDAGAGVQFRNHPRCVEVRYEDLTTDPEPTLRRLCEALGEPFDPAMLDSNAGGGGQVDGRLMNNRNASGSLATSSIGRWRRDMSPHERAVFQRVAGELLIATGYADSDSWVSEPVEPAD